MQFFKFTFLFVLVIATAMVQGQRAYKYPSTPEEPIVDNYFGIEISDPFRWMENPQDPRLDEWLKDQQKISQREENRYGLTDMLRTQLSTMYRNTVDLDLESDAETTKESDSKYIFSYRYQSYERTPDLYYKPRNGGETFKPLIKTRNFQTVKDDRIAIDKHYVNEEYDLLAVTMSKSGSDWREMHFYDLKSGKRLPEILQYLRSSSSVYWSGKGLYYDRFSVPAEGRDHLDLAKGQALYYHKIGSTQSQDKTFFVNPDQSGQHYFSYTIKDGNKLILSYHTISQGRALRVFAHAILNPSGTAPLKNFLIYPVSESIYFEEEMTIGEDVYFKTNMQSPNGKVVKININEKNKIVDIVPEYDISLREVSKLGKDKMACLYRNEGKYIVIIYNLQGELLKKIEYPEGKKVNYLYEYDDDVTHTRFSISSFYHPDLWFEMDLNNLTVKPSEVTWLPFDANDLETRYIKYPSKDGTLIPMYITCLKNTVLNGKNPTLLYGYGGYGFTVVPHYDHSMALWLLHGGILAIPNIRGGGGEGTEWAKAGRRQNKQNTIDDFIGAAEYLIRKKYTQPKNLGIKGGSHGGMLVAAAMTQRPKLFQAVIAEAGVYDMLRFEKYTVGSAATNLNEFGSTRNKADFTNLSSYSPLHNIHQGVKYPNTLLVTGDSDDRVLPFHTYKLLSTLQSIGSPSSLYQLYLIPGSGHSGASTPSEWVDKMLFEYNFLFKQLDVKLKK